LILFVLKFKKKKPLILWLSDGTRSKKLLCSSILLLPGTPPAIRGGGSKKLVENIYLEIIVI
jgi:hypothetical protein